MTNTTQLQTPEPTGVPVPAPGEGERGRLTGLLTGAPAPILEEELFGVLAMPPDGPWQIIVPFGTRDEADAFATGAGPAAHRVLPCRLLARRPPAAGPLLAPG